MTSREGEGGLVSEAHLAVTMPVPQGRGAVGTMRDWNLTHP